MENILAPFDLNQSNDLVNIAEKDFVPRFSLVIAEEYRVL